MLADGGNFDIKELFFVIESLFLLDFLCETVIRRSMAVSTDIEE